MTRVVFLLMPHLHVLDLAGPAQVFSTASDLGYPYKLDYVAEREDVPTAQGITLRAATTWPELTQEDLVVVPGRRSRRLHDYGVLDLAMLERLADHHTGGGLVASVCAGAEVLARAGLLDGRRCTTHHDLQDELARLHPRAMVVRDVLYEADNRVITSAGIASGIDLALHLVSVRHGPSVSARVARTMVVYVRRNGDEQQASTMLRYRAHLNDVVHQAQDQIDSRFTTRLSLAELTSACGISERTLSRRFTAATGLTPLRYQQELRVERAEHLVPRPAMFAR